MKIRSSALDLPRKVLCPDLWIYTDGVDLPVLRGTLRVFLLETIADNTSTPIIGCHFYGGSASYQWSEGADVDVSVYLDFPEDSAEEDYILESNKFKSLENEFEGHPVHIFVKAPGASAEEFSEASYDVLNDKWVTPPRVFNFDPDVKFAPFIRQAETVAESLDERIGRMVRVLSRSRKTWWSMPYLKDPQLGARGLAEDLAIVKALLEGLSATFLEVRDARYAMHERLMNMADRNEMSRFQEEEIVWKYLDRSGYNDILWRIYKVAESPEKIEKFFRAFLA